MVVDHQVGRTVQEIALNFDAGAGMAAEVLDAVGMVVAVFVTSAAMPLPLCSLFSCI